MNSPLRIQPRDVGIKAIPPMNADDPRVRIAEEDSLASQIALRMSQNSRSPHWQTPIVYGVEAERKLSLQGRFFSAIHPEALSLNTTIVLPALSSTQEVTKRNDRVYLVNVCCVVGAEQDAMLGQVSFYYKDYSNPAQPQLRPTQKENSRRYRSLWLIAVTASDLTPQSFIDALPNEILEETETERLDGNKLISVADISESGQQVGGLRLYFRDEAMPIGNYQLVGKFVEVAEICQVVRTQNYVERGLTNGNGGEEPFSIDYSIVPIATPKGQDTEAMILDRLFDLFAGKPGRGSSYSRTVQNLISGLVAGNPGRAGESAASPNGSPAIGDSGRITFTNQRFQEFRGVQIVTVQNDGQSGSPVISIALPGNSPPGTVFSPRPDEHKIYNTQGVEQAALGRFLNTGNALTWIGTPNSSLQAGQQAYIVPAINYPAGSGFSIPFDFVETAWINGVPVSPANIRYGEVNDIRAYTAPANNENFIVVVGRERAALHYIYQKITVVADASGVARVPNGAKGCFAFVEGVTNNNEPINKPIVTGLTANSTYNALLYYAPALTQPVQFQMRYTPYQGRGATEAAWLNGATVVSRSIGFITSQGGGNSVFTGDARVRFSPIAMHVPSANLEDMTTPYYQLDAPMQLFGEPYNGAMPFRPIELLSGAGLSIPSPGMKLSFEAATGLGSGKSINGRLLADNNLIGCRSPLLEGRKAFLIVMAFLARKDGAERLVVMARTTIGNENIPCDIAQQTGFDMFMI
jgi:hypothetical protein